MSLPRNGRSTLWRPSGCLTLWRLVTAWKNTNTELKRLRSHHLMNPNKQPQRLPPNLNLVSAEVKYPKRMTECTLWYIHLPEFLLSSMNQILLVVTLLDYCCFATSSPLQSQRCQCNIRNPHEWHHPVQPDSQWHAGACPVASSAGNKARPLGHIRCLCCQGWHVSWWM